MCGVAASLPRRCRVVAASLPRRTLAHGQATGAQVLCGGRGFSGVFVALGDYHGYAALLLGSIFGKAWEGGGSHLDAPAQARYMVAPLRYGHAHTCAHTRTH
jgi:hypothetical protein